MIEAENKPRHERGSVRAGAREAYGVVVQAAALGKLDRVEASVNQKHREGKLRAPV